MNSNDKTRKVTFENCRTILGQPSLTDQEAEELLCQFYLLAEVMADAFIEQQCCIERKDESLIEPGTEFVGPVIYTA